MAPDGEIPILGGGFELANEEELTGALTRELRALGAEAIGLELEPTSVISLVSVVQLALRHPEIAARSPTANVIANDFVEAVRAWFSARDCKGVVEIIRRGGIASFDT